MQEPRPLTTDEIRFFRYNGFLKLPWRLPDALVQRLKDQIDADIEQQVEPLVRDYRGDVMRLSAIWERGAAFQEAMGGAEVVPALESLIGPDVELMLNRHNHLTLRRQDDRTAMSMALHRDVTNWSRTICTILFYLEDTNLENGCTQFIPGSHLLPNVAPGSVRRRTIRGGSPQGCWSNACRCRCGPVACWLSTACCCTPPAGIAPAAPA